MGVRALAFTTVFPSVVRPHHGLFVQERLRHCAALPGVEVRVVAPRPIWPWPAMAATPRRETVAGLAVEHPVFRYTPRYGKALDGLFLFASSLPTVRRIRQEWDFDLIDAHFGYPDGFAAVLLGKALGRPVAITLRGTEPLVAATGPVRRRALAWALRSADRIIAVAQPLADFARTLMAEYGPPDLAPPVEVVANGVDTARFRPSSQAEARRALDLPETGPLIVSVGHLSPRKGFHRVLGIFPDLLRTPGLQDLRFAVVGGKGGETDNGPELRRLAAELGIADRILFAGPQPPEAIATWLNAADLFVLASDHEGCPNVIWEALACGLPVVGTRVGEVPAMVPDFAGIVVDDANDLPALRAAIAAVLERRRDSDAIRAWAEGHTWDGVARRVVAQWASMVSSVAHAGRQRTEAGTTGSIAG